MKSHRVPATTPGQIARNGIPALLALMLVAPVADAVPLLPERIANAPENSWIKLNDNLWPSVWPDADQAASHGTTTGVMRAWSSFAWDSARGDLILWGGGHANYSGNEVYRWRSSTMQWERGSLPTAVTCNGADCVTVDGPANSPISAHTYDNSAYLPVADRFITFGGNKYNLGGSFYANGHPTGPYLWDPNKADPDKVGGLDGSNRDPSVLGGQMWENRDPWSHLSAATQNAIRAQTQDSNATTAVVTVDGKDVIYQSRTYYLLKYTLADVNDASQDTWEIAKNYSYSPGLFGQGAMAMDAARNLLLRTSGSSFYLINLNNPNINAWPFEISPIDLSGHFPVARLQNMGLEYDTARDRFLLWEGLDEIWALYRNDLNQWVIDSVDPFNALAGSTSNELAGFTGILGKWKYAADWDVFVGAFDWITGDVFAYKPTGWSPSALALIGLAGSVPAPGGGLLLVAGLWLLRRSARARSHAKIP